VLSDARRQDETASHLVRAHAAAGRPLRPRPPGRSAGRPPMSKYQYLPDLTAEEHAVLTADIAEHGVEIAVVTDEHGNVIDGHNRRAIAASLGITCPEQVVCGLTDAQKRSMALRLNAKRRNLTPDRRRPLVARLYTEDGMTQREIAAALGVSVGTVAGDLSFFNVEKRDPRGRPPKREPDPPAEPAEPARENTAPPPDGRGPAAAARRRELIREMAAKGYTSGQIAAHAGVTDAAGVRKIAREEQIEIPADKAVRGRTPRIDSNRVIGETVADLQILTEGIGLADFTALDPAQAGGWAASIARSIRVLKKLHDQLKEISQ
jgi:ParB-like chromosome segregation protein Spo0J